MGIWQRINRPTAPKISPAAGSGTLAAHVPTTSRTARLDSFSSQIRDALSTRSMERRRYLAHGEISRLMSRASIKSWPIQIPAGVDLIHAQFAFVTGGISMTIDGHTYNECDYLNETRNAPGIVQWALLMAPAIMASGLEEKSDAPELRRKLEAIWEEKRNQTIHERSLYRNDADLGLKLTSAIIDELIDARISRGQRREDIVVCVAAHGEFDDTIILCLRRGLRVVSREDEFMHSSIMHSSNSRREELQSAIDSGRLILSNYRYEKHPSDLKYDFVIWECPQPAEFKYERVVSVFTENIKEDGIICISSDAGPQHIQPFFETGNFEDLLVESFYPGRHGFCYSLHFADAFAIFRHKGGRRFRLNDR